ncbi:putative toxin-antitoxin system toxin component, PIN family [Candidatus Magnetomonas plexicatena]|uniref:putative toxin-antitoxin system toxin component, PIN family n=1 Tax=Candidatus Magnetomonas plexicatena TaxID=2552947 RepID=UPI001104C414|nr:putative toxin-antitoxin system toxin component, PIN family [Nitrospirales bacterium LBB_01]
MLKVVLDANIFISAMITAKGNPAKIIDLIRVQEIELVLSLSILEEIKRVLLYPHLQKIHKRGQNTMDDLNEIAAVATFTKDTSPPLDIIKNDPSDNKYLACAMEGGADFIISGDNHLLDLKNFHGIEIVKPEVFLYRLTLI